MFLARGEYWGDNLGIKETLIFETHSAMILFAKLCR